MTPEQQRIAIAEACGLYEATFANRIISPFPDYLNDLNAMQEAEKTLTSKDENARYNGWLAHITEAKNYDTGDPESLRKLRSATASQRAEAFLRTKGKLVE